MGALCRNEFLASLQNHTLNLAVKTDFLNTSTPLVKQIMIKILEFLQLNELYINFMANGVLTEGIKQGYYNGLTIIIF